MSETCKGLLQTSIETCVLHELLKAEVINQSHWPLEESRGQLNFCSEWKRTEICFDFNLDLRDSPIKMEWTSGKLRLDLSQRLEPFDRIYREHDARLKRKVAQFQQQGVKIGIDFKFREARQIFRRQDNQALKWVCIMDTSPEGY
jgi:hypothetical protein